jgi:hypothetical protein
MSNFTYPDGTQLTSTALTDQQIESAFQLATCQMLGILTYPISPQALGVLPPSLVTYFTSYPPPAWTVQLTITSGLNTAVVTSLLNLYVGLLVSGTGIPALTYITNISGNNVTLSNSATVSGTVTASVTDVNAYSKVRIGWQIQGQPGPPITQDTTFIRYEPLDTEFSRLRDAVGSSTDVTYTTTDIFTRTGKIYWTFYGPNALDRARAVRSALITIQQFADLLAISNLYINPSIEEPRRVPENFQGEWWERIDLVAEFNEQVTETYTVGTVESVQVTLYDKSGELETFTAEV